MQKRYMLRRHMISAWHKTIDLAYSEGLINSERSLQHYLCCRTGATLVGIVLRAALCTTGARSPRR